MRKSVHAALVTIGLASAMHVDWHLARPTHHRLSLGWSMHWIVAVPLFLLLAWYVSRVWPQRRVASGAIITALAVTIAQGLEPLYEVLIDGVPLSEPFQPARVSALLMFLVAGIVSFALGLPFFGRRSQLSTEDA